MQRIEDHDRGQAGEVVYYAHGSESLRTFMGISKLHVTATCAALTRRAGTVVRDRMAGIADSQRCKVCHPHLVVRRVQAEIPW